jgi:hypothetical protein
MADNEGRDRKKEGGGYRRRRLLSRIRFVIIVISTAECQNAARPGIACVEAPRKREGGREREREREREVKKICNRD